MGHIDNNSHMYYNVYNNKCDVRLKGIADSFVIFITGNMMGMVLDTAWCASGYPGTYQDPQLRPPNLVDYSIHSQYGHQMTAL